MTREEAARYLAAHTNIGAAYDHEIEKAYLALTAPPAAAACDECGGTKRAIGMVGMYTPQAGVGDVGPCPNCAAPEVKESLTTAPLTVAGAIDWEAAYAARAKDPHLVVEIVTAATRNFVPVKVPTREELAVSIYGAVLAENGPSLVTRERLAAADAILALMEGK